MQLFLRTCIPFFLCMRLVKCSRENFPGGRCAQHILGCIYRMHVWVKNTRMKINVKVWEILSNSFQLCGQQHLKYMTRYGWESLKWSLQQAWSSWNCNIYVYVYIPSTSLRTRINIQNKHRTQPIRFMCAENFSFALTTVHIDDEEMLFFLLHMSYIFLCGECHTTRGAHFQL